MPRGSPSQADLALIEALHERGLVVSPYQLERWRRLGLIPRNVRRWLGRGKGSTAEMPDDAIDVVTLVAQQMQQGRSRHITTLHLIITGNSVTEAALRDAFRWVIDRVAPTSARRATTQSEIDRVARRIAQDVSPWEPILVKREDILKGSDRPSPNQRRRAKQLREAVEIMVLAHFEQVSMDSLARVMLDLELITSAEAEEIQRDTIKSELEGVSTLIAPTTTYDLSMRTLKKATFEDLVAGARVAGYVQAANFFLFLWYILGNENARIISEERVFGVFKILGMPRPNDPSSIVTASLALLANSGALADAETYAEFVFEQLPSIDEMPAAVEALGEALDREEPVPKG